MTTGNEPAQLKPEDQSVTDAAAATPGQTPLNITSIEEVTDPDLIELRDAEAAAKAEELAAKGTEGEPVAGDTPATPAAAKPTDPAVPGRPRPTMIPKARFDEVLSERDKALQDAAYHRGRAEAAGAGTAPAPGQQQPVQDTPEKRLLAIHDEIDALAQKFDDGEIRYVDFKKQERALTDREQGIREELLLAKVRPATPAGSTDELYLETLTAEIEVAHPWVGVFEQVGTQADWDYIKSHAVDRLIGRGVDPTKRGTIERYELRKEMAALADKFGPALLTTRAKAKGVAIPGQTPTQPAAPGARPTLSPLAQARSAKLDLRGRAPPDLTRTANAGGEVGVPSEKAIETMTDEEIAALPAAVQAKFLGTTAPAQ